MIGAAASPARRGTSTTDPCVKIEGARRIGERAVLLAGAADPRFIAQHREILPAVATVVRDLVCEDAPEDYTLRFRVYGVDGVRMAAPPASRRRARCSSWASASRRPRNAPPRWCGR